MDKDEAIEIVRAYKKLLSKYMSFEKKYLFGSYAKETGNEHSGIDVAVVVNSEAGFLDEIQRTRIEID